MKRFRLHPFRLAVALFAVLLVGLSLLAPTAAPSPDSTIAFLKLTRGFWQIWLMDADGTNSRQLTTSPTDKETPSWCPGGEVINYYTSFGVSMLVEVRTGREEMQDPFLAPIPPPRGPDGRLLELPTNIRETMRQSGFAELAGLTCGDASDPIGETVHLISSDLLPEGRAIAVQRRPVPNAERLFELRLVDMANPLDYGHFRSDGKPSSTARVLSANGTLAFVSSGDEKPELWMQSGSRQFEQLTHLGSNTGHPSWSPDGEWLTFDSDFQGTPQIYRLALARRERIQLLTDGKTPAKHPVFRPSVANRP